MTITKPKIIRKGTIRDCVHYEKIIGFIGTCLLCGQVRDYGSNWRDEGGDTLVKKKARRGQAVLQERRKAGVYD